MHFQIVRYVMVGLAAAAAQFGTTMALATLGAGPGLAGALGYSAGFVISLLGQRKFTFRSSAAIVPSAVRMAVLAAVLIFMNFSMMRLLTSGGVEVWIASLFCIGLAPVLGFAVMRFWIFKPEK